MLLLMSICTYVSLSLNEIYLLVVDVWANYFCFHAKFHATQYVHVTCITAERVSLGQVDPCFMRVTMYVRWA